MFSILIYTLTNLSNIKLSHVDNFITYTKPTEVLDLKERLLAIDVTKSFIVQAPAGSGKTSLLTQRFLALLAYQVQNPEECLAITFTRKAAHEMRNRIISALIKASNNDIPNSEYEKINFDLAAKVLKKDKVLDWNLIDNPHRLKIQTFDALAMSISKKMPIATNFGTSPDISDEPEELYAKAVDDMFAQIDIDDNWSKALEKIFIHLNNDWDKVKSLLIELLSKRDQWLKIIVSLSEKIRNSKNDVLEELEQGIQFEILESLSKVSSNVPDLLKDLPYLANFAAKNINDFNLDSIIKYCAALKDNFPDVEVENLLIWQGIAELLLTKTGELRKTVTKNQGFPTAKEDSDKEEKKYFKQQKLAITDILNKLSACKYSDFVSNLKEVSLLPYVSYTEEEKEILLAIVTILPVLVGFLNLVFKARGKSDFIEVSLAASRALGDELAPTDLALYLGYKINHILVDEFQDTSIPQFNLLKQLTTSWVEAEHNTLFIVGDPQQSIYSFRKAEVGLFLLVKDYGISNIRLNYLCLTSNFRSHATIVNFFNNLFSKIFPKRNDFALGSVCFTSSNPTNFSDKVSTKVEFIDTYKEEISDINTINEDLDGNEKIYDELQQEKNHIEEIVNVIKNEISNNPQNKIGILVRSRSHLPSLILALKDNDIEFQGNDIELLSSRSTVGDLLSLTNAVLHPGDRIAWLSVLRSPLGNFNLEELYKVANFKSNYIIWESLLDKDFALEFKDNNKLDNIVNAFNYAFANLGRINLSDLIYNLWQSLGIEHIINNKSSMLDADCFFDFLSSVSSKKEIFDVGFLNKKIAKLYAKSANNNASVNIMTIHKSKGLEFDTVILPFLHKKPKNNSKELFLWQEKISTTAEDYLLMSPIKSSINSKNLKYDYIDRLLKQRLDMESLRLLYVAITRAKNNLYILFDKKNKSSNSLINLLLAVN